MVHIGQSLSAAMERRARSEMTRNPRYRWLGERPWRAAMGHLSRSTVLCHTSVAEGGPSVVSEALASGVPVIASRIPALESVLGED